MRNCLVRSILGVVTALAFLPVVLAQTPAQPGSGAAKGTPDLSGVWDRPGATKQGTAGPGAVVLPEQRRGDLPRQAFTREEPPMQPWAAEKYKVARQGKPDLYEDGRDELDPSYNCFPPGTPRVFTIPRPFEIRQFPDQVLLLFETDHSVRRIYMDGRGHPEGYPITWMGHSIGKWDGDTLVVDTVGINDKTWLDALGHPHTDALHVVERFRRVNHDTLEIDFLFDDPKAYTKPWTGKKVYQLMPPGYEVLEDVNCDDLLELGKKR